MPTDDARISAASPVGGHITGESRTARQGETSPGRRAFAWWRRLRRRFDRAWIFPQIRLVERDPEQAAATIARHIASDSAWAYPDEWEDEPEATR